MTSLDEPPTASPPRSDADLFQASARRPELLAEIFDDEVEARLDSSGAVRGLAGALAALSPGDRDVLLMVAWAELSHEEIATALGIPVGTVKSRLHRARRVLRAHLPDAKDDE